MPAAPCATTVSQRGVAMGPGFTPVTSTLSGAHSAASARVKESSEALTALPVM